MHNDDLLTIADLKRIVAEFVRKRDWEQFHTPKNLSMNLSREASELMEMFLWVSEANGKQDLEDHRAEIEDEAADVLFALIAFANAAHIDLGQAFKRKVKKIAEKYPVEKSRGKSTKYSKL